MFYFSPGLYSYAGCGHNFPSTGNSLVFGGKPVDIKEVPWQVALYTFRDERLGFQCGGALISTRFILTGNIRFNFSRKKIVCSCFLQRHIAFMGQMVLLDQLLN
jgi:secreted trypsin-like serine protease